MVGLEVGWISAASKSRNSAQGPSFDNPDFVDMVIFYIKIIQNRAFIYVKFLPRSVQQQSQIFLVQQLQLLNPYQNTNNKTNRIE